MGKFLVSLLCYKETISWYVIRKVMEFHLVTNPAFNITFVAAHATLF